MVHQLVNFHAQWRSPYKFAFVVASYFCCRSINLEDSSQKITKFPLINGTLILERTYFSGGEDWVGHWL